MIDGLGRYAGTVLGAYGITVVLLGALVVVSWVRSARVRRALARRERDSMGGRDGRA